jgi:hypothetical protein
MGNRLTPPINPDALESRVFGGNYDFDRDFGDDAAAGKPARTRVRSSHSWMPAL